MLERRPEIQAKCRICGKPQDAKLKPFCSIRCSDVDLGRWLKGGYAIPGEKSSEPDKPDDD